ncbi:MAG TPA: hypothetical protein VMS21_08265 [Methylomirabilota bacterium]|nr:hypothetical protein [Methylomirabilota bacterium]
MNPTSLLTAAFLIALSAFASDPLPGTAPLTAEGDLAAQMVAGIDRSLDRETRHLRERRGDYWRIAIEFFDGPHTIHGEGTFEFLHKHLDWPVP